MADNSKGEHALRPKLVKDYTALLDMLAQNGNLTQSCIALGIRKGTFLEHCGKDADLADRYARAREAGLDAEADRAISEALAAEDAGLGRLALDARKWYLSKLMPQKYGDKLIHGGDPANPIAHTVDMSNLSEDQKRALASIKLAGEN